MSVLKSLEQHLSSLDESLAEDIRTAVTTVEDDLKQAEERVVALEAKLAALVRDTAAPRTTPDITQLTIAEMTSIVEWIRSHATGLVDPVEGIVRVIENRIVQLEH